jgi:hypothetical protein
VAENVGLQVGLLTEYFTTRLTRKVVLLKQSIYIRKQIKKGSVTENRDAPDIRLIQKLDTGYPAGYPVRAGYRISGRILGFTTTFLVQYQIPVNL